MKIKEVLELTQQQPIDVIAKERLTIGEKTARKALREAGCYSIVGKAGWHFDDSYHPENLEQSIYYFAEKAKEQHNAVLRTAANVQTNQGEAGYRKRHSFDLDVALVKSLKVKCVQNDIPLYVAVEDALRAYLKDDEL